MKKQEVKKIEYIPISHIKEDKIQPRKNFDPKRLKDLADSIEKYGVETPLHVEAMDDGTFLLEAGERRLRAAKMVGLKELPCIVSEPIDDSSRLIKQFHIEEQKEGWSSSEKAVAIARLSESLDLSVDEMTKLLNLPKSSVGSYMIFSKIINKEAIIRSQMPHHVLRSVLPLVSAARAAALKLDEPFSKQDIADLENKIADKFLSGEISEAKDIHKITDSFRIDPTSWKRFMETDISGIDLFKETGASAHQSYRKFISYIRVTTSGLKTMEKNNGVGLIQDTDRKYIKNLIKALQTLC